MKLKATNHNYYCSNANYYVGNLRGENFGKCDYDTWEDFKEEWLNNDGSLDDDYNHIFRFDIIESLDSETDEPLGTYELALYFILQRKGIFRPVIIKTITQNDMTEIEAFLKVRWEYMKGQWDEFSK